jgi:geranylgeranyl transferase type-2 subunit beta
MTTAYLTSLDALLGEGMALFSPAFAQLQARWLDDQQQPDGGFAGRLGPSDPYYLDFALRLDHLLGGNARLRQRAARYLTAQPPPRDRVTAFSLANSARLLHLPMAAACRQYLAIDTGQSLLLYHTFITMLLGECLHATSPVDARVILAYRRPDGGFSDVPESVAGQTNSTAAAVGVLASHGQLGQDDRTGVIAFLQGMQGEDGGLRAHAAAPEGDLLSTFTGLLTLVQVDGVVGLDLPALGRFLKAVALPGGGFCASCTDTEADVEYAYYGVAALALLKRHLARV